MKLDVCKFYLYGWYFGRNEGVFGKMDNEKRKDFIK
jgi:hypothetical protein